MRSCLQDTIANIGLLFGYHLKDMIYNEIPPDTYNDTCWFDVVKNKKIIQFLRFDKVKIEGREGGPTVYLLKECYKKGVYLVLAEITADYSQSKNRHAFLYNGDFVKEKGTEFFGCLLDNRRTSPLRGLEKEDVADTDACRKSINTFFRGRTEILRIYRVDDAKNIQKHEIVQKNIRTSNKKAKRK